MFIVADRVQETTNSPGTGTATLLGAVSGYQSFSTGIGANNTTYYTIADQTGTNWEVGLGALNSTGTVLTRTTVYSSSNGGSTVNFATGTQYVWCDYPSSKAVLQGTAVNFSSIGATTAGTGAFTTLSASSTVSGAGFSNYFAAPPTIGNTTPNTGAFTTLSASSTVSGTGFSNYLASPPAIGGTAAAAGTFTALVATSITDSGLTAGRVNYNGVGGLLQDSANMTFDGSTLTAHAGNFTAVTTNQLTINTTQLGAGNASIMKNRIINGAMVIDQRNAGASGTNTGYTVDRWQFLASLTTKGTWQQNAGSVTPPAGFTNYLGFTSNSAYSVGSGDYFAFAQPIEGFNIADLGWGTANAKTITLSFQAYSSLTGTFGGCIRNGAGNRSYPFTYSIPVANTWTPISVTVVGDTSGTWPTNNSASITPFFGLGAGSTFSGTAGSWSSNNYVTATGATSVVGTSGATFYITGVQLEVGSSATGFEYRQYQQELALCQRYYEAGLAGWQGYSTNGSNFAIWVQYEVTKRTSATLTVTNGYNSGSWSSPAGSDGTNNGFLCRQTAGATSNSAYFFNNFTASSEL